MHQIILKKVSFLSNVCISFEEIKKAAALTNQYLFLMYVWLFVAVYRQPIKTYWLWQSSFSLAVDTSSLKCRF